MAREIYAIVFVCVCDCDNVCAGVFLRVYVNVILAYERVNVCLCVSQYCRFTIYKRLIIDSTKNIDYRGTKKTISIDDVQTELSQRFNNQKREKQKYKRARMNGKYENFFLFCFSFCSLLSSK